MTLTWGTGSDVRFGKDGTVEKGCVIRNVQETWSGLTLRPSEDEATPIGEDFPTVEEAQAAVEKALDGNRPD